MNGEFFKVDVNLPDHPKFIDLGDAAFRLWLTSVAYANRHTTDGFIATPVARKLIDPDRLGQGFIWEDHAKELVAAELWEDADGGYLVHDYLDHNISRKDRFAKREAERLRKAAYRAGKRSGGPNGVPPDVPTGQVRTSRGTGRDTSAGHATRRPRTSKNSTTRPPGNTTQPAPPPAEDPTNTQVNDEEVSHWDTYGTGTDCPAGVPTLETEAETEVKTEELQDTSAPTGTPPDAVGPQAADADEDLVAEVIDLTDREARRLCELLADRIHEWSGERPPIGKKWHTAARLLLTKDGPDKRGYTAEQVEYLIRWATADEFWRPNIQSMPTLRRQRLTLIGQIQRERTRGHRYSDIDAARAASIAELDDGDSDGLAGGALR